MPFLGVVNEYITTTLASAARKRVLHCRGKLTCMTLNHPLVSVTLPQRPVAPGRQASSIPRHTGVETVAYPAPAMLGSDQLDPAWLGPARLVRAGRLDRLGLALESSGRERADSTSRRRRREQ